MKKISQRIVKLLRKKKFKIAFAESCTGGLLSSTITSVSGSSKIFNIGLVTYSNQSKMTIKKYGAVSMQCCLSMVSNLNKIINCNIAVSITGIAGPKGGSKQKPVGLVYIGIKNGKKIKINKYLFKNKSRTYIQRETVKKSLELILTILK